jgi:hypothetical protein
MACPVIGSKHIMVLQFAQPGAILWGFEKDWKPPEAAFIAFPPWPWYGSMDKGAAPGKLEIIISFFP